MFPTNNQILQTTAKRPRRSPQQLTSSTAAIYSPNCDSGWTLGSRASSNAIEMNGHLKRSIIPAEPYQYRQLQPLQQQPLQQQPRQQQQQLQQLKTTGDLDFAWWSATATATAARAGHGTRPSAAPVRDLFAPPPPPPPPMWRRPYANDALDLTLVARPPRDDGPGGTAVAHTVTGTARRV